MALQNSWFYKWSPNPWSNRRNSEMGGAYSLSLCLSLPLSLYTHIHTVLNLQAAGVCTDQPAAAFSPTLTTFWIVFGCWSEARRCDGESAASSTAPQRGCCSDTAVEHLLPPLSRHPQLLLYSTESKSRKQQQQKKAKLCQWLSSGQRFSTLFSSLLLGGDCRRASDYLVRFVELCQWRKRLLRPSPSSSCR